jgi:hypothetical protein
MTRPSVVTPERFASGMTFEQYLASLGTAENLGSPSRRATGSPPPEIAAAVARTATRGVRRTRSSRFDRRAGAQPVGLLEFPTGISRSGRFPARHP